ncbi:hypothetical protein NPIL_654311 [Nephila pilipes]|uniref:Uncharacterized protein n=1 Tax=Nephila pilipes TaxID=299642 RepID=A0A8X6NDI0_NEPPI|nr:hypothetical protein NPIL_654311 [Nephila pilipes]
MARTKQTAQKKKEKTESIANKDPPDLESDTDDETETMDTENENSTDPDQNKEACLIRTRMEEKFNEAVKYINHYRHIKFKSSIRTYFFEERQKIDSNIHKFILLKLEIAENLKKTVCPN